MSEAKPYNDHDIDELTMWSRQQGWSPVPETVHRLLATLHLYASPISMRLPCPSCGTLHIDEGEFATKRHHTHACQSCGAVWRPAVVPTVGVRFLPGFKNE